jgi:phosphoenolpyruvate-protein phosphotransferase
MKNSIREVARIVQAVSLAAEPGEQVKRIVESISQSMAVDVCSLYLANAGNEMELLASHGLAAPSVRKVRIPAGKGLVGLVASTRHPINVADAEQHPSYYYVAETQEERFHGFCAVPLVSTGKVIGVLVVQSSEHRQFSPDEESFLVTLAAQLAMLFTDFQREVAINPRSAQILTGIRGAPGIGLGMGHFCGSDNPPAGQEIILVGRHVNVADMAAIPAAQLKGVISADGSALSHTAVLANAMGIPAILGVANLEAIPQGELLILDGDHARILLHPTARVEKEFRRLLCNCQEMERELEKLSELPAITTDGHEITLLTNTGLLADVSPGLKKGAQGVGLYRTEIPFMVHESFPTEEEQTGVYRQVLEAYDDKPVYMRTLDIGGDKKLPYFPVTGEENPALGWRGMRFLLDNSQILMTQVRAMLRASEGRRNLRIVLPMITSCAEVDEFAALLADAMAQLKSEGYRIRAPQVGIMIEVPAAISQIAFWAGKIDFLTIGSNDLSQHLLAIDRDNPRVAAQYDHTHPAVLHEIKRIIRYAKLTDIPVSLCGEMATDPLAVVLLVGLGLRTLSMSAVKLPYMKALIRAISLYDAQRIANQAMLLDSPKKIRTLVQEELEKLGHGEMLVQFKSVC